MVRGTMLDYFAYVFMLPEFNCYTEIIYNKKEFTNNFV